MRDEGSITRCLAALKGGDQAAAGRLWEEYSRRLAELARKRLRAAARRAEDEEDVALSAFDSVCRRAGQGRFPKLDDRDDLWRVMVVITIRKAIAAANRERRVRRGNGRVRLLSELDVDEVQQVVGDGPTPELAALASEQCRHLFGLLTEPSLCTVARRKLEGYTNAEIAREIGCVEPTVERKLQRIRSIWSAELDPN
jgi:DNA-directed RNA polymerase specialized sigma24 family protein